MDYKAFEAQYSSFFIYPYGIIEFRRARKDRTRH